MEEPRTPEATDHPYEPPEVESVLTAEELIREIKYAGDLSVPA